MKSNDSGNNYGSTVRAESDGRTEIPKQTFSISEPTYNEVHLNGSRGVSGTKAPNPKSFSCCRTSGKIRDSMDGLRIIIISMFVFSVGVTVALVIHIAAESPGEVQDTDKVVSGHASCSSIGDEVLALGGNAVDAAVASTFCMALMEPHITGLGGGGMMFIHQKRSNNSVVIDFREMAPAGANNDIYIKNPLLAQFGRSSIAIPGFLAGLEYAHEKFGSGHIGFNCCQWSDLLWKTIHLALKGVHVSQHFKNATETKIDKDVLASNDSSRLRDFILPNGKPVTEESVYSDIPIYNELIKTLKMIAQNGSEIFYRGSVGESLVNSLAGSITMEDLANYKVVEADPIVTDVGDFQVMTAPSPSAGPELLAFLNTLETYNETQAMAGIDDGYLATIARVLKRLNRFQLGLGDPSTEPIVSNRTEWFLNKNNTQRWLSEKGQSASLDESTSYTLAEAVSSHVAVMDKKDNYVSVVTSLNTWFGSKVMTENGILMNNALANFDFTSGTDQTSTSANQMSHLKRPLTSNVVAMATDITNICGRRIVMGGATPDAVGQVLNNPLFLKGDLVSSTSDARLVIWNDTVYFEDAYKGFSPEVLEHFRKKYEPGSLPLMLPYTSVNSLEKNLDVVLQVQDIRSLGDDDQSDEAGKVIGGRH